jgi:hypothetical protein
MDKSTNGALAVEHEIQRLMLERLSIEWTPGEPFYSLVEAEIERLRAALGEIVVGAETEMALYKVGFLARRALDRVPLGRGDAVHQSLEQDGDGQGDDQ